jgi:hypothetical protein
MPFNRFNHTHFQRSSTLHSHSLLSFPASPIAFFAIEQIRRNPTHRLALESVHHAVPLADVVVDRLEPGEHLLGVGHGVLVLEDGAVVLEVDLGRRSLQRDVAVHRRGVSGSERLELVQSLLAETETGVDLGPVLDGL